MRSLILLIVTTQLLLQSVTALTPAQTTERQNLLNFFSGLTGCTPSTGSSNYCQWSCSGYGASLDLGCNDGNNNYNCYSSFSSTCYVYYINVYGVGGNINFAYLPTGLKNLNMNNLVTSSISSLSTLATYTPSLQTLQLSMGNQYYNSTSGMWVPSTATLNNPDITALPSTLQSLNMYSNYYWRAITGTVSLASLPSSLTSLSITQTNLTGTVNLNSLPSNLQSVNLYNNMFTTLAPITNLPASLSGLNLENNMLSGNLVLKKTPYYMYLSNNKFTGTPDFSGLSPSYSSNNYISYIDISSNQLSGTISDISKVCQYVNYLNAYSNQLTGFNFAQLNMAISNSQLCQLTTLNLQYNQITGPIDLSFLAMGTTLSGSSLIPNCRQVYLYNNKLTSVVMPTAAQLSYAGTNYFYIDLRINNIAGPVDFSGIPLYWYQNGFIMLDQNYGVCGTSALTVDSLPDGYTACDLLQFYFTQNGNLKPSQCVCKDNNLVCPACPSDTYFMASNPFTTGSTCSSMYDNCVSAFAQEKTLMASVSNTCSATCTPQIGSLSASKLVNYRYTCQRALTGTGCASQMSRRA